MESDFFCVNWLGGIEGLCCAFMVPLSIAWCHSLNCELIFFKLVFDFFIIFYLLFKYFHTMTDSRVTHIEKLRAFILHSPCSTHTDFCYATDLIVKL